MPRKRPASSSASSWRPRLFSSALRRASVGRCFESTDGSQASGAPPLFHMDWDDNVNVLLYFIDGRGLTAGGPLSLSAAATAIIPRDGALVGSRCGRWVFDATGSGAWDWVSYDDDQSSAGPVLIAGGVLGFLDDSAEPWVANFYDTPLDPLGIYDADASDIDGDDYGDILVPVIDGATLQGTLYVDRGPVEPFDRDDGFRDHSELSIATTGTEGSRVCSFGKVTSHSDLDGDGLLDIACSTPEVGVLASSDWEWGETFIFEDRALAWWTRPYATTRLESGGDLTGDGYDDLVMTDTTDLGAVWIVSGRSAGWTHGESLDTNVRIDGVLSWDEEETDFGYSVAFLDDFDGDGFGDLAVGAPNHQYEENTQSGRVYICDGGPSGTLAANASAADCPFSYRGEVTSTETEPAWGSSLGTTLMPGGDLDGDGLSDLYMGAGSWTGSDDAHYAGKAYYVLGHAF